MKFKSLKTRVLFWFGSLTAGLLLIFSLFFCYFFNKGIMLSLETKLYHKALYIQDEILPHLNDIKTIHATTLSSLEVAIIKEGKILKQTDIFELSSWQRYLQKPNLIITSTQDDSMSVLYHYPIVKPFMGEILVYEKNIDDKTEDIIDTLLILNPILLLLLLLLANRLIDKILLPIKCVTQSAQDLSVTHFSNTIPLPKEDNELKDLVDSFNAMIMRLKEGVETMDRFNSDVSHELKTPLTVIKGEIDVTLKKSREPEYYIQTLNTIAYSSNQIQKIVDDLLLLTQFTQDTIASTFENCSLDGLLIKAIETYTPLAKEKNIVLHVNIPNPIVHFANPLLMECIFVNLLDNAIKYTPSHKNIYLSLTCKETILFSIRDEGIGIPQNCIAKLTDRFYRVDASRNKKVQGFGIGLSLVKKSVELHNGDLHITSEVQQGTKVEVVLSAL